MSGPLRVAVVGSGPAGFYAAGALLDADVPVEADLIERLPTPWGLVRLGVAPDHPELKTASRVFERTAAKEGFRFFGNVELDPASEAALEADRARARRNVDILREFAAREPAGKPKRLELRFRVSPVQILGEGMV